MHVWKQQSFQIGELKAWSRPQIMVKPAFRPGVFSHLPGPFGNGTKVLYSHCPGTGD